MSRLPARALGAAVVLALGLGLAPTAPAPAGAAATIAPHLPNGSLVQRLLEDQVLALTNRERRRHGCGRLRTSSPLRQAARGHTVSMAMADTMAHQLPGEPRFSTRISRAGYRDWHLVAENIARGYGSPTEVVAAWMASPSHRRNLLDCRLRDLGVGVVLQAGQLWWTQDFGAR
ncbi:hypothetical protein GCM10022237_31440 [Nocardioides ginsengisoli]|uniref:CAP domain-containing protein n=1 Tax=Nocardioides ginsengisoli TaxID=363868 RepID=A0ABW3VSY1_9ACTN